jgi:hypothetical protein
MVSGKMIRVINHSKPRARQKWYKANESKNRNYSNIFMHGNAIA